MPSENYKKANELPKLFIRFWLLSLIGISAFISLHNAASWTLYPDETWHIHIAEGKTLADVWRYAQFDTHPPLYYMLLHCAMAVSSDVSFLLGLSLAMGLLLIPLYYAIGRELGGETAGLACAALIALSPGCIAQSYQLRQYGIFLLFISSGYYCYLRWRVSGKYHLLAGYLLFGLLAASTHFSAIFYVFAIASYEALCLLRRRDKRAFLVWSLVNLLIADAYLLLYDLWQFSVLIWSTFAPHVWNPGTLGQRIASSLSAPLLAGEYIFPAFPLSLLLLAWLLWRHQAVWRESARQPYVILAAIACGLSMAMYFFGIYPKLGQRYCLWAVPCLVPAAGCLAAGIVRERKHAGYPYLPAVTAILVLCSAVDASQRFANSAEYAALMHGPLQGMQQTLETLAPGPDDLLIPDMLASSLLVNSYRYKDIYMRTGDRNPVFVPYGSYARILLAPYNLNPYGRIGSESDFIAMMRQVGAKPGFATAKRLIFVGAWGEKAFIDILDCPVLHTRRLLYPPAMPGSQPYTIRTGQVMPFVAVMSRQEFTEDVLLPSGKAKACFGEKARGKKRQ